MSWAALGAWLATTIGGATLAVQWIRHGGPGQDGGIRSTRLLGHASLAVLGLALWIAYLASDRELLAWIAVVLLAVVAAIGFSMLAMWLRGRSGSDHTRLPAEASFPLPLVLGHGALGVTTLLLSTLAASGVG
ncbi:MAG: hypothetical protein H0W16_06225 [Actinobacteria bacterium]|nr:hypothetical protein [Actinomycetota bacterium]